jgi:hypothetical protein
VHRGSRITQQNLHPLQDSIGRDNAQTFFFSYSKNEPVLDALCKRDNQLGTAIIENDLYVSRRLLSPVGIHFAADDTRDKAKVLPLRIRITSCASPFSAWGWCSVEAV